MTNKELCERYPWLRISNRWTGEYVEGAEGTELDLMPFCQECADEQMQHINNSYSAQTDWGAEFVDIDEYYKTED